jgi:hypothetical protein
LENVQPCGIIIARATVNIPRPLPFRNNRTGLRALAFGLMLLGLCVFAWGLKYKLSLYDPPRALSHQMPAAKLLSGKERSFIPFVAVPRPANSVVPIALSTLALAFLEFTAAGFPASFGSLALRPSRHRIMPVYLRSAPAFVRPPPFRH